MFSDFISNNGYIKSLADSDHHSERSDNILSGRKCNAYSEFSNFLFVEQQCDNAKHYRFNRWKLSSNGNRRKRMFRNFNTNDSYG